MVVMSENPVMHMCYFPPDQLLAFSGKGPHLEFLWPRVPHHHPQCLLLHHYRLEARPEVQQPQPRPHQAAQNEVSLTLCLCLCWLVAICLFALDVS